VNSFLLHCDLKVRMDAVYVAEKAVQLVWNVWPDDKSISAYWNQYLGFKAAVFSVCALKFSIVYYDRDRGDLMPTPSFCSKYWLSKKKVSIRRKRMVMSLLVQYIHNFLEKNAGEE
jgi:hypothetical protein